MSPKHKKKEFPLDDDDFAVIEAVKNSVQYILKNPVLTWEQSVGLAVAIIALERLPAPTKGVNVQFGINYEAGTKDRSESYYILFSINESEIEISRGGYISDSALGGDSYSYPDWFVALNGFKETNVELSGIDYDIKEYLDLGAKITVYNNSNLDCN